MKKKKRAMNLTQYTVRHSFCFEVACNINSIRTVRLLRYKNVSAAVAATVRSVKLAVLSLRNYHATDKGLLEYSGTCNNKATGETAD